MDSKQAKHSAATAATACATLAEALRAYVEGDYVAYERKLESAFAEVSSAAGLMDKAKAGK